MHPPPRRAALVFIFLAVLLDVLALGVTLPVLPALVRGFLGGDTPRAAECYGLFNTIWALMQFIRPGRSWELPGAPFLLAAALAAGVSRTKPLGS